MAITDFDLVKRSLSGRLFSTVTTVLLVGVSVGLMLTLLSMKNSGQRSFERGAGDMHLLLSKDSSAMVSVLNGIFYANPPANPIDWREVEALRAKYPFSYLVPTAQGDSYRGLPVTATDRSFFTDFAPNPGDEWRLTNGKIFDAPFQIVAGAQAARETGLALGDRISVWHGSPRDENAHEHDEFEYEIVGILAPTGGPHDRALFSDLTSAWVLHAHDRRVRELGADTGLTDESHLIEADKKITGLYAKILTRPGSDTSAAVQSFAVRFNRQDGFTVASPGEEIKKLFGIVSNIDQVLVGMAAVVMLSSAVAIMLTLTNAMRERRRQIAVLRVLGASKARIFGLVMTESAILGLLGGVLGIIIAVVGSAAVAQVMWARLGLVIDATLEPRIAMAVVMSGVALAVLAGLAPAIAGYRTAVARNLRPTA